MSFNGKGRNVPHYEPDDEIYTPPEIFERLDIDFDLDVCAPVINMPWVRAKRHYHLELDGLAQPWEGRVWCNPPYSKPKPWILKFLEHGNGIMLVSMANSHATKQFWQEADGILYLHQLKFVRNGKPHGIFMPVVLLAMGDDNVEALWRSGYGRVRV